MSATYFQLVSIEPKEEKVRCSLFNESKNPSGLRLAVGSKRGVFNMMCYYVLFA